MRVFFYTLGCKVNQYESQSMSENLINEGFELTHDFSSADVIVVNSCTVTSESDRKTRQAVRRFKRLNPSACVVLTGCMTQAQPSSGEGLVEADVVLGNNSNELLSEKIKEFFSQKNKLSYILPHISGEKFKGDAITRFDERDRAFLKIEDGCDRFCSYCIIPYARGRVRSKSLEEIRDEIGSLARNGYREIVLVGINLSSYGKDTGFDLADAVKIANDDPLIKRVRLGSIEPDSMTDELIDRLKGFEKFCPQFHLSLQSGCDRTLRLMNRHYTAAEYEKLCLKLRNTFEDATITTDVMVGFPQESEEDFEESLEFCKRIAFEKVHVFPYSVRKGTRAEKMAQVEKSVKDRRAAKLSECMEKIRLEFFAKQVGKTLEVLVESSLVGSKHVGYTKNYTPVIFECDDSAVGSIVEVLVESFEKEYCCGKLV